MNIAVVGAGYVGLVTGTCLAEIGNQVICVDRDEEKIRELASGKVPFYEPGLESLLAKNQEGGRIRFGTDLSEAASGAILIFIAVGTPEGEEGAADLSNVFEVARALGRAIDGDRIVVLKSTVPVGTAEAVSILFKEETDHRVAVVSNPEFLKEGAAVNDFLKPDRIILGGEDRQALEVMEELYAPFVRTGNPILITDWRSAELVKYAANAMLATRITLMNELANLADRLGADIELVRRAVGSDSRIGPRYLFPGLGFGGSCFPKDLRALSRISREVSFNARLIDAVLAVNREQPRMMVEKMRAEFGGSLQGRVFAVWGLAFKARTDDIRQSPAIALIEQLLEAGAEVRAHDPVALSRARKEFAQGVAYFENEYEAVRGADGLVVATEWSEYREPNFERLQELLSHPAIFDGRNLYSPAKLKRMGFSYWGVGRGCSYGARDEEPEPSHRVGIEVSGE